MPIKLPKSFGRRKSSGNILEDVETHPQSSFRVFERPGPQRSMTDGAPLTKRMSEGNAVPSMLEDPDNIFAAGADHEQPLGKNRYEHDHGRPFKDILKQRLTRNRHSGGTYESSTSTRLSSSSTLPSSTEIQPEEAASPHSRIHDIPVPPPLSGALRAAAGRTFSFGGRFGKNSAPPAPPRHATPDESSRQRAVSGGTDGTATPPKLPDSHWDLGAGTDDFGKMFDHLDKRDSAALRDPSPQRSNQVRGKEPRLPCKGSELMGDTQYSSSPPTQALPEFQESRAARPAPISTDRSIPVEPSPYSWDSRHSRHPSEEGLLNDQNTGSRRDSRSPAQLSPDTVGFRRPSPGPNQMLGATTAHRALERPTRRQSGFSELRRSGVYSLGRDASPVEDEDAKLVRKSWLFSKEHSPPHWTEGGPSTNETPLLDKGKSASPGNLSPEPDSMFTDLHAPDPSIADTARLAVQFAESVPKTTSPGNKVMTKSQFEHYREQQELRRSNSDASKSDDESVQDEYDDEDETEKQRETERQRRKQEAHLAVYRQSMMKITGQQASLPSLRPEMSASGASSSTPNLHAPNRLSHLGDKSSSGKSTEDDDEEIPLGILAAHGFPNRARPPNRLVSTNSNPNLRASLQPSYASSVHSLHGGGGEQFNRSNMPAFARNLPPEPFIGAGLYQSPNRENLAMGGGSGSVYGGASSPAPAPGGLINVIANEERVRAARRGSPNTQAIYDHQMAMGAMGPGAPVPRPYSMMGQHQQPPPMTPTEQAQLKLSNQMSAMMQMHMEMMQTFMHGGQGTPPAMMQQGMPMPPMMGGGMVPGGPTGRPVSMPNAAAGAQPNFDHRTLSMLDPNITARRTGSPMPHMSGYPFAPPSNAGYASSIAPSERSTAGMAPRYRPVSTVNNENERPGALPRNKDWKDQSHLSPMGTARPQSSLAKPTTMATVTVRPVSQTGQSPSGRQRTRGGSDEDDDDEGWADMMKKRDKKKSNWKLKKGTSSFGDLLGAVH
ncbi:hypothetical protein N7532_011098 [Penicillium argentinense]|uniref:Uncharacterized protein n=1 Tax=Penicillium argentinense TaxID=1131581 RepID=A0A9W9EHX0_9EURO|nr:uncharacterized protein N7532_011098 [Penicillium argentinense]KAJ5082055.1 hypothetical protein N7532_011098 [Penicillium argentinense]